MTTTTSTISIICNLWHCGYTAESACYPAFGC